MLYNDLNQNRNMYLIQIYSCLAVMVAYASYHVGLLLLWMGEVITPDSLIGPGALTMGTVAALIWYVRRDIDQRKAINEQYEQRIEEKNAELNRLREKLDILYNSIKQQSK